MRIVSTTQQRRSEDADQRGVTLPEIIIATVVTAMMASSIIGVFTLALGMLRFTERPNIETSYAVTGELSRSAALVVPQQECVDPAVGVHIYSECVRLANQPLLPVQSPAIASSMPASTLQSLPTAMVSDYLCWNAIRLQNTSDTSSKILVCWTHDDAADVETLAVSYYEPLVAPELPTPACESIPSAPHIPNCADNTWANQYIHLPANAWNQEPYSTVVAAHGIEKLQWELGRSPCPTTAIMCNANDQSVVYVSVDVCAALSEEDLGRKRFNEIPRCVPDRLGRYLGIESTDLNVDGTLMNDVAGVKVPNIIIALN